MITLQRTNSANEDFLNLVTKLDAYLKIQDGDDHEFYAQYNKVDKLNHVVVAYRNEQAIGCGAIKKFDENCMEVKRMYVLPSERGQGVASQILAELEHWAKELNYKKCILETGHKQPEAIILYKKRAYKITSNYGQYEGLENSICFEKVL